MKTHHCITSVLIIACALSFLGCNTTTGGRIQARINEKPDVFAALTSQQQKDIKWGYVRPGYTTDMVYFAYGHPDKVIESDEPGSFIWIFIDRSGINQDVALASAMQGAAKADSTTGFSGSNANYPTRAATTPNLFADRSTSTAEAYASTDAADDNTPAVWIIFRDNTVLNVRRMGNTKTDKTGSLGG